MALPGAQFPSGLPTEYNLFDAMDFVEDTLRGKITSGTPADNAALNVTDGTKWPSKGGVVWVITTNELIGFGSVSSNQLMNIDRAHGATTAAGAATGATIRLAVASDYHDYMAAEILALTTKVGIDSSSGTASIDYLIKDTSGGHDHDGVESKTVLATDINITGLTASQLLRVDSGTAAIESSGKTAADIGAAHKDDHDPQDGSDALDAAAAVDTGTANAEGSSHSLARADHVHALHDHAHVGVTGDGGARYSVHAFAWSVAGDLTTGTGKGFRLRAKQAITFLEAELLVKTAPSGAAIIVDINKDGTSLFTTPANRPEIAAAATEGESTTFDVTTGADDDVFTIDIDQIGSGTAGADLTALLWFKAPLL